MFRCILLLSLAPVLFGQTSEITAIMNESAAVWNRGDLVKFVSYYEDSKDTVYVGKEISRGVPAILERYRKAYPTKDAMGTVQFSEMEVRPLGPDVALCLGKFHLTRSAAGGGDATGRFTVIFRKTAAGWKIIHDHSSSI
jgi:uncharacterized protein (TIGR02246 family)